MLGLYPFFPVARMRPTIMTIDARAFRDTLGRYPTGVSIITTTDGQGGWSGATIGSFSSLSLTPPLVLFCLDKSALCHPAFMAAKVYAVNVLAEDQTELSNIFASRNERPWSDLNTRVGKSGAPLLDDCVAWIECEMEAIHPGGDHDIFVGRVMALEAAPAGRPLLYFGGGYRRLDEDELC